MATKKQLAKPTNGIAPWKSAGSPDDLGPAERIAHEILTGRRDLLPSVERIMTAGLGPEGTLKAISLFRDALGKHGDVHRDPRVAIEVASDLAASSPAPTDR
jgi:hypothetical protein